MLCLQLEPIESRRRGRAQHKQKLPQAEPGQAFLLIMSPCYSLREPLCWLHLPDRRSNSGCQQQHDACHPAFWDGCDQHQTSGPRPHNNRLFQKSPQKSRKSSYWSSRPCPLRTETGCRRPGRLETESTYFPWAPGAGCFAAPEQGLLSHCGGFR